MSKRVILKLIFSGIFAFESFGGILVLESFGSISKELFSNL
jgi:hypothetical protein